MSLLHGPVVFIDDQIANPATPAYQLAQQILESGRPLAQYSELPPAEHAEHWRSIAFLVLDWDLAPGSLGALGSSTLSEFARLSLFEWLEAFIDDVFCPVFIVSAEDVEDINRQISENSALQRVAENGRIAVFPKQTVISGFLGYLDDWVAKNPALSALNIWANEYETATDRLFQDMDKLAPDWPAYVWRMAEQDHVDPSYELTSVITANLLHRINAPQFDVPAISGFAGAPSGAAMRRVSFGRTSVPGERLNASMVLPGDVFSDPKDENVVWINVLPSCHTVLNRPAKRGEEPKPAEVALHLLRGEKQTMPATKTAFNNQRSILNNENGMLIHTLLGEEPYAFSFKAPRIAKWGEVSDRRIARLLPPYITLLQQRHAAFLMNEGLPRVEWDLYS